MRPGRLARAVQAGAMAIPLLVCGCATLPAEEASAFKKIAAADRDAVLGLSDAEAQAVGEISLQDAVGGDARFILDSGCSSAENAPPCRITIRRGNADYALDTQAPYARKLISGIADYGDAMSTLATAKDLDAAKSSAAAVGGSIKGLAALIPGVGAMPGAVIDLAVWAGQKRLVAKRRAALLAAAEAADPLIAEASAQLTPITVHLRQNLINASSLRTTDAAGRFGLSLTREKQLAAQRDALGQDRILERTALDQAIADARDGRRSDALNLIAAAKALNAAREIDTDFSSLAKAHRKVLAHLQDPQVSLEDALTDLNIFLSHVDALKIAAKGS